MLTGPRLLHAVAQRVIAAHLRRSGAIDVAIVDVRLGTSPNSIDIRCSQHGSSVSIKVKADPYFGTDKALTEDRDLPFYRAAGTAYAFEAISDTQTRQPGWMFSSPADQLYYYRLVVAQSEADVAALLTEGDDVLFAELRVDRDELRVLPMVETRAWFEQNYERYAPRPIHVGTHTAWFRLVPFGDLEGAVSGIRTLGGIFRPLARGLSA